MTPDPDVLVDLVSVPHGFEAETIAESLQSRGIRARAFTTVGDTLQWEAGIKPSCLVQVPRSQLRAAQIALASLKSDSIDIDWDELFPPDSEQPSTQDSTDRSAEPGSVSAQPDRDSRPAFFRKELTAVRSIGIILLGLFLLVFAIGLVVAVIAITRHAFLEPR